MTPSQIFCYQMQNRSWTNKVYIALLSFFFVSRRNLYKCLNEANTESSKFLSHLIKAIERTREGCWKLKEWNRLKVSCTYEIIAYFTECTSRYFNKTYAKIPLFEEQLWVRSMCSLERKMLKFCSKSMLNVISYVYNLRSLKIHE